MQLGGKPNLSPEGLTTRSHAEYVEGGTLREMIEEDLVAERIAIESYKEIVLYIGEQSEALRRVVSADDATEIEEHSRDHSRTVAPAHGSRAKASLPREDASPGRMRGRPELGLMAKRSG